MLGTPSAQCLIPGEYFMPHTEMLETRLKLLSIDHRTVSELHKARDILVPVMGQLLNKFYKYIKANPELCAYFSEDSAYDRARSAQEKHWLLLFDGKFDRAYFENTINIGRTHARIGLTLDTYISGYNQMYCQFIDLITQKYIDGGESPAQVIQATNKAIFLDMDLVMHCYLDDKDSAMRHILSRATEFRRDVWKFSDKFNAIAEKIKTIAENLSVGANTQSGAAQIETGDQVEFKKDACSDIAELAIQSEEFGLEARKLENRLRELPLSDKLYLDYEDSKAGAFSRLISLVLAKS